MSLVQAVCPLPEIFKSSQIILSKGRDPKIVEKQKERLRAKISRSWIFLTLNNASIMWTYARMRGDLPDSYYGNLIGNAPLFHSIVGLTTNLITLFFYDSALDQFRYWIANVLYLVAVSQLLSATLSIETLANVAMVGNSLSVGFGPYGILRALWINH